MAQGTDTSAVSSVHARSDMERFLDHEKAQVWALDRATGEPRYIGVGQADALRNIARAGWRCPFPDCAAQISTRGGSKRDHFWHPSGTPHVSDGESEAHLGAKAMLAAWATSQCPDGAAAVTEETVTLKEPGTAMYRRADVMVTWKDGAKTAFEVEYKNFAPEDWQKKQADYDRENVSCAWILGHTRVRHRTTTTVETGEQVALVRLPPLAATWAATNRFVLVVNPVTRQIGTVAGDQQFTRRPGRWDDDVWMRLDDLSECDLDPVLGVITPTMRGILSAEDDRRREETDAQRRRDEIAEQRRRENAVLQAPKRLVLPQRSRASEHESALRRERAEEWRRHPLRQRCIEHWGTIPTFLVQELSNDHGVAVSHEHWHCLVFATFVDTKPVGSTFKVNQIIRMLTYYEIPFHEPTLYLFPAVQEFISHLEDHRYVEIGARVTGHIHGDITVLAHWTSLADGQSS